MRRRLAWLLGGVSIAFIAVGAFVVWGAGRVRRFLP